jgi:hypothetical protein
MSDMPKTERRAHERFAQAAAAQLHHDPSGRDFPGRCIDVSQGGLRMYIPAATPVRPGQLVQLTLSGVTEPALAGLGDKPLRATIVRVDRRDMPSTGQLAVGVKFTPA